MFSSKNIGALLVTVFFGITVLPLSAQQVFEEFIDSEDIKTLTLYAFSPEEDLTMRYLNPAVAGLRNNTQQIFLEFDDLRSEFFQYSVRLVNCEVDWTQSQLLDQEIVSGINQFYLDNFEISQSTKVPYYHYRFMVPKPKVAGNYILQLYESDRLVAQQKFWIYDSQIDVNASVQSSANPEFWKTHQQLNIKLELGNFRVGIPHRELRVFVRKNQHLWREIKFNDFRSSGRNSYTLQQFDDKNLFPAGNEFRYLDIGSSFTKGQNVDEIQLGKPNTIFTYPQRLRSTMNYSQSFDMDGGFVITNLENSNADITADYVNVIFELLPFNKPQIPLIYGKFTDWKYVPMELNPDLNLFTYEVLLKGGVYDFAFALEDKIFEDGIDREYFEGDFNLTGNTYEIFVYHTAPGQRFSSLVGYQLTRSYKK